MELAGQIHSYYNKHKVIGDDVRLSSARLALIMALLTVLKNALTISGLSAPETM
jgi:arginyl-tRNA synthetase